MVVPSPKVAKHFTEYADSHHLPLMISICPYPVMPNYPRNRYMLASLNILESLSLS
jgi:hypothetical protein